MGGGSVRKGEENWRRKTGGVGTEKTQGEQEWNKCVKMTQKDKNSS
jgi:hypothetical protein